MKKVIEFDKNDPFDESTLAEKIKYALLNERYINDNGFGYCEKDFSLIIEVVEKL